MQYLNRKISIRQLQALLALDIFGAGIIILPRRVAEYANQDGWIIVILSTAAAIGAAYLITTIGRMFPKDSFVSYTSKIMSKPLGILISFGLVIKIILNIAMELRFFGEIVKSTILYNTPFYVVCGGMILVSAYAASKGYEVRGRLAEILIFVVFIPLVILFLLASVKVDFTNLLPIMKSSPEVLFKGSYYSLISFTGLEFCLLIHPYMIRKKSVRGAVLRVVAYIGGFMLFITIITISKFGPHDVKLQMWPVLEMMDVIDLPGSFVERQDALIMSFWIISVFFIVNAGFFFLSIILKDITNRGKHIHYILLCIPIVFAVSFIPKDIMEVMRIIDVIFITFGLAYLFIIPLMLLVVAKIRKMGVSYD